MIPSLKIHKEDSGGSHDHDLSALLASKGVIIVNGEVNTELALEIIAYLRLSAQEGLPITLFLNSPGGEVNAGLMVYDVIQSYPHDITIICVGMAASMGAIILAGGRNGRRFILPHSKVMIHEPLIANGFGGSATTIEQKAKTILDVKKNLNEILAKHTGRTLKEIEKATAFDNYMTAQEAIDFGICDAVSTIY